VLWNFPAIWKNALPIVLSAVNFQQVDFAATVKAQVKFILHTVKELLPVIMLQVVWLVCREILL